MTLTLARPAHAECSDLAPLERLLADVKTAHGHGACLASDVAGLPPAPNNKQPPPEGPAMTVRVTARGFSAGMDSPTDDLQSLVRNNPNIQWERTQPQSALHGVAIEAEAAAPARLVKQALAVLAQEHIKQVWLIFKPKEPITAPAPHALDSQFAGHGRDDVMRAVGIVRREVAVCAPVQRLFGRLGGQLQSGRIDLMVTQSVGALKECNCTMKPATLTALWWNLAFKNLAVAVPVAPGQTLPFGSGTWGEAAPAVLQALGARP
jgi:hypothetical protein